MRVLVSNYRLLSWSQRGVTLEMQIHEVFFLMRNTNWTHSKWPNVLKQLIFVNKCYIGRKQNLQLDSICCVGGSWNPGRSVLLFTFNYTSQCMVWQNFKSTRCYCCKSLDKSLLPQASAERKREDTNDKNWINNKRSKRHLYSHSICIS